MSVYGLHLFPQHAALLEASAISPEVARERGYVSVDTKSRLEGAGFSPYQRRVPGLLIPVHDAACAVALYQYRPDEPRRTKKNAVVKYETPGGSRMVLDVPPRERERIGNPSVPLWITEGSRKADAAVSAGLCCIALLGVTAFRGTNKDGGKVALADWEHVALNDRRVYICFDSDVMLKRSVHQALVRLGSFLARRGARVAYVYLPGGESGTKVGLDDYLASGGAADDLLLRARSESVEPELPGADDTMPASTPSAVRAHLHTPPTLASEQDILARLVSACRVCGLVGEDRNAQLTYLALASRRLEDPVSVAVKGLSSSGKSFTTETVLRFVPEEAVIAMTAMSERALIYMEEDFAHRTIVLFEAVALREEREKTDSNLTAYIIRSLLSEGEIRYPVTVRGPDGNMVTKMIIKKGPTNFICTTTATSLHRENETRMLSLPTNDSAEQTRNILLSMAAGPSATADFDEWHAFDDWLGHANHRVVIPFATYLARNIPPVAVRLRRDFRALLRLIETHAIMHQLNRKTDEAGRIVATETDYLAIRGLVAELIADAVGATIAESVRETVETVRKLAGDGSCREGVTVHDLEEALGIERSAAQRRLTTARERGYLVNVEEKKGRPAKYVEGDPLPEKRILLPERVCSAQCTPPCTASCGGPAGQDGRDGGVCRCAASAEGIDGEASSPSGDDSVTALPPTQAVHTCTACGEPLDQRLVDAGFTDHGENPAA